MYCSHLYAGHLWLKYSANVMRKLKVAYIYNNAARIFLGYEKRSSASSMFVTNQLSNFDAILRKQIHGFMERLSRSKNCIVRRVYDVMYFSSDLRKMWIKSLFHWMVVVCNHQCSINMSLLQTVFRCLFIIFMLCILIFNIYQY